MKRNRFLLATAHISSYTINLLNSLLPLILAEFIWFAISFIQAARLDPLGATAYFHPMIEYLMTSLLLSLGGAVVFDIALLEQRRH